MSLNVSFRTWIKFLLPVLAALIAVLVIAGDMKAQPWPDADPSGPWPNADPSGPWINGVPPTGSQPAVPAAPAVPSTGSEPLVGPWPNADPSGPWVNGVPPAGYQPPPPPPGEGPWPNADPSGPWINGVPPAPVAPPAPQQPGGQPPAPQPAVPGPNPGTSVGGTTVVNIQNTVALGGVKRFGMNIGRRDQYGAAQYIKNVIPNPGFEAGEYAMVVLADAGASANRLQADNWDTQWNNDALQIGQPAGFWDGAQFEVLHGAAKGRTGSVTSFSLDGGKSTFNLSGGGPAIGHQDVVVFRKPIPGYYGGRDGTNRSDGDRRPGTSGQQSLRLLSSAESWKPALDVGLDSFGRDADASAGKLLHVQGNWRFEVWAKPAAPGANLRVSFRRVGEGVFIDETIPLNGGWQKIERNFFVDPTVDAPVYSGARHNALSFSLFVEGGDILVDDIVLRRADYHNPTVFTDAYVNQLRQMRPGILRNWGAQLGSSLDNQLADEFARKTSGSNPENRVPANFHYSIHEFLKLSQQVGAEPWYVIPPTWTPAELQNFIAYLAAPAGSHPYANRRAALGQGAPWTSVFGTIHIEFGNELWGSNFGGDPFIGASFRGGVRAGQISNDRIAIMKAAPSYPWGKINHVLGGQTRYPPRQGELEANSTQHNEIGFAPYYGDLSDSYANDHDQYGPTFAHAKETVTTGQMAENRDIINGFGRGTGMSIYEINIHAVKGFVPLNIRNDYLSGAGVGLSLPLVMLHYQRDMGIRNQAAFQSVEFSKRLQNGEYGRIWGLVRDVETTGRIRPTGLGLELANLAIRGDLLQTDISGSNPSWTQAPINSIGAPTVMPYVHAFAYRQGNRYSVILFNLHLSQSQPVQLQLPTGVSPNATIHAYAPNSVHSDNEDGVQVALNSRNIGNFAQGYNITLPPHSAHVIEWTGH